MLNYAAGTAKIFLSQVDIYHHGVYIIYADKNTP